MSALLLASVARGLNRGFSPNGDEARVSSCWWMEAAAGAGAAGPAVKLLAAPPKLSPPDPNVDPVLEPKPPNPPAVFPPNPVLVVPKVLVPPNSPPGLLCAAPKRPPPPALLVAPKPPNDWVGAVEAPVLKLNAPGLFWFPKSPPPVFAPKPPVAPKAEGALEVGWPKPPKPVAGLF